MTRLPGPLDGVRVLDLTRVMAGPTCTQLLGDLGADVIKVERPASGDDTRKFGPPFLKDEAGKNTTESAYFLGANRNKRSVAIELTKARGQELARRLAARSDVLVENFKVGTLAGYGLAYEDLKSELPRLVYCSITGFGQTGPYATRPGYDFLIQGMGGIMSITGEPEGAPQKLGVPIADIMAGMYAAVAVLAALRHRELTGAGQYIDIGMLDTEVAWLANQGMTYLVSGKTPERLGNAHPHIVPYQVFATADGYVIVTVANDAQFQRFSEFAGVPELAANEKFRTNDARVRNRDELIARLEPIMAAHLSRHWLDGLERLEVGCGPINTIDEVFADPQVRHRGMVVEMDHPLAGRKPVRVIASPMRLAATPVSYRHHPPLLGEQTEEVLRELLDVGEDEFAALREGGIV